MDAAREQAIIRLWNRLRLLARQGRPVTAVLRQIEKALADENVMRLDTNRREIEQMRAQVQRQRGEI